MSMDYRPRKLCSQELISLFTECPRAPQTIATSGQHSCVRNCAARLSIEVDLGDRGRVQNGEITFAAFKLSFRRRNSSLRMEKALRLTRQKA